MTWALLAVLIACFVLHEAGHAVVARRLHAAPKRFQIGVGPTLVKFHVGATLVQIKPLPLGAAVEMADGADDLPAWKRALVIAAGPAVNLGIAMPAIFVMLMIRGASVSTALSETLIGPLSPIGVARAIGQGIAGFFTTTGLAETRVFSGQQVEFDGTAELVAAFLVLNMLLGVFNLIPLPPLDGGKLAVLGIEGAVNRARRTTAWQVPTPVIAGVTGVTLVFILMTWVVGFVNDLRTLG